MFSEEEVNEKLFSIWEKWFNTSLNKINFSVLESVHKTDNKGYHQIAEKLRNLIASKEGVRNIADFTNIIYRITSLENIDKGFVYRGEPKTYNQPFLPKFRREIDSENLVPMSNCLNITAQEVEIVKKFRKSKNCKSFTKFLKKKSVDWLPLAAHYQKATRLLDATRNALVALYFASNKYINEYGGWVYMVFPNRWIPQTIPIHKLEPYNNLPNNYKQEPEQGIPNKYDEIFEPNEFQKRRGDTISKKHFYLLDTKDRFRAWNIHKRIIAQDAIFFWWDIYSTFSFLPPKGFTKQNVIDYNGLVIPIPIKKDAKKDILKHLEMYYNISKSSLFPDQIGKRNWSDKY